MAQRLIDLVLATLASMVSVLLSWPYFRDFATWPESPTMWWIYIVSGFVLAIYVFYVFIGSLRTLFLHDEQAKKAAQGDQS